MHVLLMATVTTALPEWLALVVALTVAWRVSRGGGGEAITQLSEANRVLEKRIHELGGEVRDLRIENESLRQRTDFAAVIAKHEERAQKRAESMLRVLNLIADRLGPDPEHPTTTRRD